MNKLGNFMIKMGRFMNKMGKGSTINEQIGR